MTGDIVVGRKAFIQLHSAFLHPNGIYYLRTSILSFVQTEFEGKLGLAERR